MTHSRRGEILSKAITNIIFKTIYKNKDGSLKNLYDIDKDDGFIIKSKQIKKRIKEISKREKEDYKYLTVDVSMHESNEVDDIIGYYSESETTIEIDIGIFNSSLNKDLLGKHYHSILKIITHEVEHMIQARANDDGIVRSTIYKDKRPVKEYCSSSRPTSKANKEKYTDKLSPFLYRSNPDRNHYSYIKSSEEIASYSTEIYFDYIHGKTLHDAIFSFLIQRYNSVKDEIYRHIRKDILSKNPDLKVLNKKEFKSTYNPLTIEITDERMYDLYNLYKLYICKRYNIPIPNAHSPDFSWNK